MEGKHRKNLISGFWLETLELQDNHLAGPRVRGTGKKLFVVYPVEALITGLRLLFIPFRAALTLDQTMTEPDSAE